MHYRVYLLRRRGRRLPWREVQNSPVFEGELRTRYLALDNARYFVASCCGLATRSEADPARAVGAQFWSMPGTGSWCRAGSSARAGYRSGVALRGRGAGVGVASGPNRSPHLRADGLIQSPDGGPKAPVLEVAGGGIGV